MKNLLLIILTTLSLSSFGWHFRYVVDAPIRWHSDTNTVGFKFQDISFPNPSPQRATFMTALTDWNVNPSHIRAKMNGDTNFASVGNGQNEIWFTDNTLVLSTDRAAVCISHFDPLAFGVWNLMETDIIFNPREPFMFNGSTKDTLVNYGGGGRGFRGVAEHELGHALGLQHEDSIYNIMGDDRSHANVNGPLFTSRRGEDASQGLVHVYGLNTSNLLRDVGISHWKYYSHDGEYSTHQRNKLYKAAIPLVEMPYLLGEAGSTEAGEPIFLVEPGKFYLTEFTFENNGNQAVETVSTGFYLSTNSLITTFDTFLRRVNRRALRRDTPNVIRDFIRVPPDMPRNTRFYIGAIVDDTGTLRESDENNNASYLILQTAE